MLGAGIDPLTFRAEAENLGSELSSHVGGVIPLPYMETESPLSSCVVASSRILGNQGEPRYGSR